MNNELLFIVWTLIVVSGVLAAFRFGRIGLFAVVGIYIILANIFVLKQISLFGFAATGGNALYGAIFLATDLLNEHYGRKEAQKAVWFGWVSVLAFLVASQFFLLFVPSVDDFVDPAMKTMFSLTPRIVIGSLIAYLISQTHDVFVFSYLKKKTKGKHLWLRNNVSTGISQLIDSLIFSFIAFWGVFPTAVVLEIVFTTYLLKILVAIVDTPFIYLSYKIKRK